MINKEDMKITFLGAAGEVTGSCYLVEGQDVRFLVDCGMFQGGRGADAKNWAAFKFDPHELDFVVLTHAHIDHCGLIPRLCRDGFNGPIYSSNATTELLTIMLRDSAHIHEHVAERTNRRRKNSEDKVEPLYTMIDADNALTQVAGEAYDEVFHPHDNVKIRLRDAGHILGSAILEIWIKGNNTEQKIVFSGDLGQPGRPILRDPYFIREADYLVVESTYGNRQHKDLAPSLDELVDVINETITNGKGNIIVPAFAVGRTQEIIYYLHHLTQLGRVKDLNVFLDSPMAQSVTDLTKRHLELFDAEAKELVDWHTHSGHKLNLKFTQTVEESIALNKIDTGSIIISASGMCTAGRILHHLRHGLGRRQNTVLITGYQAQGTLGRRLIEGAKTVKIFGKEIAVKAKISTIGGFSAHADQHAILRWLNGFENTPIRTFITHGEPTAASALAQKIDEQLGWDTLIAEVGQEASINGIKS